MRRAWFAWVLIGSCAVVSAARAQAPLPPGLDCTHDGMACKLWVPEGYDPAQKRPLVVYLHGIAQRGIDNVKPSSQQNSLLARFLPPMLGQAEQPFVLVPQCRADEMWVNVPLATGSYDLNRVPESAALKKVRALIANVGGQYSIDPDRIYVVGYSMGGYGAWDMIARTPEMFAGATPVSGGGPPAAAAAMKDVAVWASHNGDDPAVSPASDRQMFRALALAGGRPYYTEPGTGGHTDRHGASSSAGWLMGQRRGVPAIPALPGLPLRFEPQGGMSPGPIAVTIQTTYRGVIRYTTDGTLPTATIGTEYTGPVMLSSSAILTAVVVAEGMGNAGPSQLLNYHAQTYVIGDTPLPDAGFEPEDAGAPELDSGAGGTAPDAGAAGEGGSAMAGGGGGGPGAGGATGGGSGPSSNGGAQSEDEAGCSCRISGAPRGTFMSVVGLLLALMVVVRWTRRRGRTPHP